MKLSQNKPVTTSRYYCQTDVVVLHTTNCGVQHKMHTF